MSKILCIDIETSPNLAHVWQLWKTNVYPKMILEPSDILGFAWGEYDPLSDRPVAKRSIQWVSRWDGERAMLDQAHEVLDQADIVLTKNGKRFDVPRLKTALALHEYDPPKPFRQIDLEEVCKRTFSFPSHSLDYVCKQFGLGGKVGNEAGYSLWREAMSGDAQSRAKMGAYCRHDVWLTIELYRRVRPWIERHPNVAADMTHPALRCPKCGHMQLVRDGMAYTSVSTYQRWKCVHCGNRAIRGTARLNRGGIGITEAGS
jgi:DNA polymerase elongation subunit (family B)